jgi:hypothetical protein
MHSVCKDIWSVTLGENPHTIIYELINHRVFKNTDLEYHVSRC